MGHIKSEAREHILFITLDRPDARNAFNGAMAEEMEEILDAYDDNPDLCCAIISANGPTFSAGQDLKAALHGEVAATARRGGFGIMKVPPSKPLIAAIDGQALAGGMELALCCDIIVASTRSVFGLAEARRGLVAVGGGCFRLPHRIPHHVALEMVITAEPKTASDMHRLGLVNSLVEPDAVMAEAERFARLVVRNAPLAVQASKALAYRSSTEQWSDARGWEEQPAIVKPAADSDDRKEGMLAFSQKRDPVWTGH